MGLTFIVGFFSGIYGTLVGGGFLVIVPFFMIYGLPVHTALGTARLSGVGTTLFGIAGFHKTGYVNYKIAFLISLPLLIGSLLGSRIVLSLDERLLEFIIAGVILVTVVLSIFNKDLGLVHNLYSRKRKILGLFLMFIVGVYGGFIGIGVSILLTYLMILFFGQTFLESAATRKIGILLLHIATFIVFLKGGLVNWELGISSFFGTGVGSFIGSKYSGKIGEANIKKMFLFVVLIMVAKIFV